MIWVEQTSVSCNESLCDIPSIPEEEGENESEGVHMLVERGGLYGGFYIQSAAWFPPPCMRRRWRVA